MGGGARPTISVAGTRAAVHGGRDRHRRARALDTGRQPRGADLGRGGGFQSYPTLLEGDGGVPAPLRAPASGTAAVDLGHRDARLALGNLRDGRLLVVLTRFD